MTLLRLLPVILSLYVCDSAKILVVFNFPARSHSILGHGFVRVLLEAGHEVTHVTAFPSTDSHPMLKQIDVSKNLEILPDKLIDIGAIINKEMDPNDNKNLLSMLIELGKITLSNAEMKKLIDDDTQEFDLVVVQWLFSEMMCGLSVVYNCPYIWVSTVEPHWMVLKLIDESPNPAYNPDVVSDFITPFSFTERVHELFKQITGYYFRDLYYLPIESEDYEEIYRPIMARKGRPLPSLDEVRHNASLMFGNSHVSLGQATRLPQNYKPIAGYHIDPNVKPLPEDLKNIMDNAKNGFIYFSMGSNLKSKNLPDEIKKGLIKLFGELKYTVIWKFEETLPGLPNNLHILKWAPQQSILAHENCILFITHGGLLSTTEALYFGKPMIGIPVFADQFINIGRAVRKGFAIKVDLSYSTADDLKIAIEEFLSNSSYASRAKELSLIFHDRPVSPAAELAHWVQHVVRTRGAQHLRSPALLLPFYQKMYLDLAAVILIVLLSFILIIRRLFCTLSKNTSTFSKKTSRKKTD